MELLLDTHVFIAVVEERRDTLEPPMRDILAAPAAASTVSVVSLWEIAIKFRLGKLPLRPPLLYLPELLAGMGLALLDIKASHVLVEADPLPPTRDPFDRILLSQCLVENLRLVTLDRALATHPLAWRPA